MTTDEAYDVLCLALNNRQDETGEAWRTLDEALRGSGGFPTAWDRLSASAAAARAGKDRPNWSSLVTQGYAPPPDGEDTSGRGWWHPATVDAYSRCPRTR
jgi:hypothetical protein